MTDIHSTTTTINHRRLPRRKRPLSFRDEAIYIAYRSQGLSQEKLADDYRLSQSRISQILRRVESWHNSPEYQAPSPESLDFDLRLARAQSQAIYDRALRAFDHAPHELTTTKEGHRDHKPFQETTRRAQAPNIPALNTAQRAVNQLSRVRPVSDAAPKPGARPDVLESIFGPPRDSTSNLEPGTLSSPADPPEEETDPYRRLFSLLYHARLQAETDGLVPPATSGWQLVENLLSALLGSDNDTGPSYPRLDDAHRQLLLTFLKPFPIYLPDPKLEEPADHLEPAAASPTSANNPEPGHRREAVVAPAPSTSPASDSAPPEPQTSNPEPQIPIPSNSSNTSNLASD